MRLLTTRRRQAIWTTGAALVIAGAGAGAGEAVAGEACVLPSAFPVAVAERSLVADGGAGVVAPAQPPGSPLRPGDVVRQAGTGRVEHCADVEREAAEAFGRGLPLLLAVEREGRLVAVLVEQGGAAGGPEAADPTGSGSGTSIPGASASGDAPREAPRAAPAARSGAAAAAGDAAPPVERVGPTAVGAPPVAPPPRVLERPLPTAASPEVRRAASAAAAALRDVERSATLTVPLAHYERRLRESVQALAAIDYGTAPPAAAVRAAADDVRAMYQTAADIRRVTIEYLTDQERQLHGTIGRSIPYFSDSEVPSWLAAYPFLQVSVEQPPRATRLLVPGEIAGRWRPDDAVELLWDRARAATARLAAWASE